MDFSLIHILNMVAGLILCVSFLKAVPWLGKSLETFSKLLNGFEMVIGVAILLYVCFTGLWTSIYGIFSVFGSLILISAILPHIPAVGKELKRLANWLSTFQGIIGIVLVLLAVWGILAI